MADRFARLTGPTVQHAQPRDIDFANLREEQKGFAQMSQTADAVSNWAFKIANEQAEIEGAKYYAENPITLDQIKQAQALGQDPEDLFAGTWTTFDKAGRKVQMQQVSAEIEMQAQAELTGMLADIKMGKADLDSLTDMSSGSPRPGGKLADLIDGLSSTVKDAMPELYPTIRASLANMANSTLSTAISEQATRTLKERKVRAQQGVAGVINTIPDVIARGDIIDPQTGATITVEQQLSLYKQRLNNLAEYANDPTMAKQSLESFEKAVTDSRKAAITDWADKLPDGGPTAALTQIKNDQFSSPAMERAYKALSTEDQMKVREDVRKLRRDRVADENARIANAKAARVEADRDAKGDWLRAREANDEEGMKSAVAAMSQDIRGDYQERMRKNPTGYPTGEAATFGSIKRAITLATDTTKASDLIARVDAGLAAGTISETEASTLTSEIITHQDELIRSAKVEISAVTRYDPEADTAALEKEEVARRKAVYETMMAKLTSAYRRDPQMDINNWIDSNLVLVERRENERSLVEAQRNFNSAVGYLESQGINVNAPRSDLINVQATTTNNTVRMYIGRMLDRQDEISELQRELGISQ